MRLILHVNKLIIISSVVFFTLIFSCHRHTVVTAQGNPEIIKIEGGDTESDTLTLRDDDNGPATVFKIGKGKKIKWLLHPNAVVKTIDNVYAKTGSPNVFSNGPARDGHSQNWTGRIDPDVQSGTVEEYNIDWTDADGNKHTYDPKIQVK